MFKELMPLLSLRMVIITLLRVSDNEICINVTPKPSAIRKPSSSFSVSQRKHLNVICRLRYLSQSVLADKHRSPMVFVTNGSILYRTQTQKAALSYIVREPQALKSVNEYERWKKLRIPSLSFRRYENSSLPPLLWGIDWLIFNQQKTALPPMSRRGVSCVMGVRRWSKRFSPSGRKNSATKNSRKRWRQLASTQPLVSR